jgi:L,D-transpeptidase catalytic domain
MRTLVARTLLLAALLALPGAAPADAEPPLRALGAQGPLGDERLSNETTITRWAHPARRAVVRSAPRTSARGVARLRYFTEDARAEVYLVLASRRAGGRTWLRVRVPGRPNGRSGWVRSNALGPLHAVRTQLVVNRATAHATLYRSGRPVWRAPVGVGAPGTPTPAGRFWIRELLKASGGVYGPWAFGTSAYSTLSDWPGGGVIGIHGTNQPQLLPGRPSHGCIRVRNGDLARLVKLMPIGTPVKIL